jgi:cell division protein FtsL
MQSIVSIVAEVMGICSAIAGAVIWYISKLLSHKKDMLILQLQLEALMGKLKEQEAWLKELESEVDKNRESFQNWKDGNHKSY